MFLAPPSAFKGDVAQVDGVEIVAALLARNEFHAGVERMLEPEGLDIVVRHRQQQFDVVVGAYLGEGAGRIAGRGHHQHALFVLGGTRADRESFGLLERAGGHRGADGRIVAVEGYVEVLKSEVPGKPLALVGDGCRRAFEHAADGKPVAEFVETVFVGFHFELPAGVLGAHERRRLALRIGKHPARIFEFAPRGDALKRVRSRCKIFHLFVFVLFTTCGS